MSPLQAELDRLYRPSTPENQSADLQEVCRITPGESVRAMVLELARPADWAALSSLWRGVQTDLELPAPAIAVNGRDGYQLWFSLADPLPAARAAAFLDALLLRYLPMVAPARVRWMPCADAQVASGTPHGWEVPALQAENQLWSAFVAPDLAAIFSDGPWLDFPPSLDAQAKVLARLESIKPQAFEVAWQRVQPAVSTQERLAPSAPATFPHINKDAVSQKSGPDPKRFLQDVMEDASVDLQLRIAAATALLPYC